MIGLLEDTWYELRSDEKYRIFFRKGPWDRLDALSAHHRRESEYATDMLAFHDHLGVTGVVVKRGHQIAIARHAVFDLRSNVL